MSVNGKGHISLFLADDHLLFPDTLAISLHQQTFFRLKVIGTAQNGEDLLIKLTTARPNILLLDLNMPVMNGLDVIPVLKEEHPDLKILILTKYEDPKFVKECLHEHSVQGYILKTSGFNELLEGIIAISKDQSYISKNLQLYPKDGGDGNGSSVFDENFLAKYNLTRRELEILGLVAQAKSNIEIADNLYISPQTVGAHRKNIMRKLNITSTAGLVRFAIENQVG
jgi:DNA-binding NarL/FixJ family response regulator